MTTLYIKSDGPAVRSSVELESVDKFDHPDHGWMWRECEVRWIDARVAAAVRAEREACKQAIRDTKDRSGTNYDGQNWLVRAGRSDFIAALDARSNAALPGGEAIRAE